MAEAQGCDHCPGSHTADGLRLGSATTKARGWLLIEHPGPWPERIEQLTEPAPIADAIARARAVGVRPQLIRRSGRRPAKQTFQVYVAHSLPRPVTGRSAAAKAAGVWLEGRALSDPAELADLDLAMVATGEPPEFGEPVTDPLLLVCTHGRRNVCCARTGAPLARDLTSRFGDAVWETTHVGGDRYAANLICLPHGFYYGDLGEAEAISAAQAYLRGEVALDRLRGRAGLPEPVQAAEHFVRERTGVHGVDDVIVLSCKGTSVYEAVVEAGGIRYRVVLERVQPVHDCGSSCDEKVETHVVREVTLLNEAALV